MQLCSAVDFEKDAFLVRYPFLAPNIFNDLRICREHIQESKPSPAQDTSFQRVVRLDQRHFCFLAVVALQEHLALQHPMIVNWWAGCQSREILFLDKIAREPLREYMAGIQGVVLPRIQLFCGTSRWTPASCASLSAHNHPHGPHLPAQSLKPQNLPDSGSNRAVMGSLSRSG